MNSIKIDYGSFVLSFDVYISATDGATVIHIDTEGFKDNQEGPYPLRVYMNDNTDNPLYRNEGG